MGSCCSTSSHRPKLTSKGALRPESSRSRRWRRTSSNPQKLQEVDGIGEEELQNLPKRKFSNGFTENACLFTQQGRKGTNQDAMLHWEDFGSREDTIFCGVFDGHGPYGHMVAKKVRDSLPLKLCNQWKALTHGGNAALQNGSSGGSMNSEKATSMNIDEEWVETLDGGEEKFPEIYLVLRQALLKASKLMDKELKLHATIDCFCSGTTAVTLVKKGQDLVIGNVGDSRAVLATRDAENSLQAVQLTTDLKPNLPREAARIQQCKGRVFALQDEPEVSRVWLPNSDSPGLAMARAFGDFCLKDYGLISVPDITYRHLTDRDEFIVLATDGVWDVFSNKEVVDIIASAPSRGTAARALVDCAVRAWRLKFPTSKIDDCAVVCLFLNPLSSTQHENSGTITEKSCEEPLETSPLASTKEHQSMPKCSPPQNSPLENSHTPEIDDEIVPIPDTNDGKLQMRSNSTRSLADCISTGEEEEWSALEGFTRVNSLLNLPRFLSGDKRSASRRKWL